MPCINCGKEVGAPGLFCKSCDESMPQRLRPLMPIIEEIAGGGEPTPLVGIPMTKVMKDHLMSLRKKIV